MTLHQSARDTVVQYDQELYDKCPIAYLADLDILGPNVLLAHVPHLDDSELETLARTHTKTVMCPVAALKRGREMTWAGRLPDMVDRDICVSLGTDVGNHPNLIEPLRSMSHAAVLYKDACGTTDVVPAGLAIRLAKIQGAKALGLEDEIGSLKVGKKQLSCYVTPVGRGGEHV